MKIALVIPKNFSDTEKSFYDYEFIYRFLLSRKHFSSYLLAVPTLASLTPPEHTIRVFDENLEPIEYGWKPDLVGISVRTMFAMRAYRISEAFRKQGAKTVLGGIHPSMCPEESLEHCDTVVIGEAEPVWSTVLEDAKKGQLKTIYGAGNFADMALSRAPDRSLLQRNCYINDFVQTTKGCPFHCEFCSVYAFDGQKIRSRSLETVIGEIEALNLSNGRYENKRRAFFFADDNIIANKEYARRLFRALKPLNLKWGCQASIDISREEELLKLMKDSGCGSIFIGFESIAEKNLARMSKSVNLRHNYLDAIRKIQQHGLLILGSFILGYDFDTKETFGELIEFIDESRLLMPAIHVLTPFPGTRLFNRLEAEGRILHKDWSRYDTRNVVFRPALMTPEELHAGSLQVLRAVYSFESIYRRLRHFRDIGFWMPFNEADPVRLSYRLLFAIRMCSLLLTQDQHRERSRFIVKMLPKLFSNRYRVTNILQLMACNDYAYS